MLKSANIYSIMDSKIKANEKSKGQNITVVVRCRPRNEMENNIGSQNVVDINNEKREIVISGDHSISGHYSQRRSFTFDRVFDHRTRQIDLYKTVVSPILEQVIQGYSCTIFAYGQTGTGKTYTMEGKQNDSRAHVSWDQDPESGIIPRSIHQLFEMLDRNKNISEFSVNVSFLEIYNEDLFDLLGPPFENQKLRIFDDSCKKGAVFVQGLEEFIVHNKAEVYSILERGASRRQTAATLLNASSSRSHTVFSVTANMKASNMNGEDILTIGKLYLVDLAGSENIGRSGAIDRHAREAGTINQSLLTLGRVIFALVEKTKHIPYRESKLTRLLQDSLGGRTKTVIIATISPTAYSIEETLSTLEYAYRAKDIKNRPEVNQMNKKGLIKEYSVTIDKLRRDLAAARDKNGIYLTDDAYHQMQSNAATQKDIITELQDKIDVTQSQLDNVNNMFEETRESLKFNQEQLSNAKNWLFCTRNLFIGAQQKLGEYSRNLRHKEIVTSKLSQQQQEIYEEAKSLKKLVNEEFDDIKTLKRKTSDIRISASHNQTAVTSFEEYLKLNSTVFIEHLNEFQQSITNQQSHLLNHIQKIANHDKTQFESHQLVDNAFLTQSMSTVEETTPLIKDLIKTVANKSNQLDITNRKNQNQIISYINTNVETISEKLQYSASVTQSNIQKCQLLLDQHTGSVSQNINQFMSQCTPLDAAVDSLKSTISSKDPIQNITTAIDDNRNLSILSDSLKTQITEMIASFTNKMFKEISHLITFNSLSLQTAANKMFDDISQHISRNSLTLQTALDCANKKDTQLTGQIEDVKCKLTQFPESYKNSSAELINIVNDYCQQNFKQLKEVWTILTCLKEEYEQKSAQLSAAFFDSSKETLLMEKQLVDTVQQSLQLFNEQLVKLQSSINKHHDHVSRTKNDRFNHTQSELNTFVEVFNQYSNCVAVLPSNTQQFIASVVSKFEDHISSRTFDFPPHGDTPKLRISKKMNSLPAPLEADEISSNVCLSQSQINACTPTLPKHRSTIMTLKSIRKDETVPPLPLVDNSMDFEAEIAKENVPQ